MTIVKGLHIVSAIVTWSLSALIVFLMGVPLYLGVVQGYKLYDVATPSMEPTLSVGSLVAVDTTPGIEPHVGDIVTFKPYPTAPMTITHRLVGETTKSDGRYMVTQGDANEKADAPVPYKGLIGVVRHHIPYLGKWHEERSTFILWLCGGYILSVISYVITNRVINKKKEV